MHPVEFNDLAQEAKKVTLKEIHSMGITDTIRVFCSKRKRTRIIGQYKGFSQFDTGGILFRLFPSIVDIVREDLKKDEEVFGYTNRDLPTEVLSAMTDTLVHEYGHVIAELMKCQRPRLYSYILRTWKDEEDYAEDFMRLIRRNDSFLPESCHIKVLKAFKKELI